MAGTNEREAIGSHIKDNWTECPVAWPNRKFSPPTNANWIRVSIFSGEAFQLTMGGIKDVYRHPGEVTIQCFTPVDIGDYEGRRLADAVAALFRKTRLDGLVNEENLVFQAPSTRIIGVDGAWFQVNVSAPFYRDSLF